MTGHLTRLFQAETIRTDHPQPANGGPFHWQCIADCSCGWMSRPGFQNVVAKQLQRHLAAVTSNSRYGQHDVAINFEDGCEMGATMVCRADERSACRLICSAGCEQVNPIVDDVGALVCGNANEESDACLAPMELMPDHDCHIVNYCAAAGEDYAGPKLRLVLPARIVNWDEDGAQWELASLQPGQGPDIVRGVAHVTPDDAGGGAR